MINLSPTPISQRERSQSWPHLVPALNLLIRSVLSSELNDKCSSNLVIWPAEVSITKYEVIQSIFTIYQLERFYTIGSTMLRCSFSWFQTSFYQKGPKLDVYHCGVLVGTRRGPAMKYSSELDFGQWNGAWTKLSYVSLNIDKAGARLGLNNELIQ